MITARTAGLGLLGLTLVACTKGKPESLSAVADRLDFAITPALPAPEAGTYGAFESEPRDRLIRELVQGLHHDGTLASAAAGIALAMVDGKGALTRWELREASWKAGWPYTVHDARSWAVRLNDPPPRDLLVWLEAIPEEEPMGLVRARGRDGDVWVGLRGMVGVDLGPVPRAATLGTPIRVPAVAGGLLRVADGIGQVSEHPTDKGATILLTHGGEWLFELTTGGEGVATFPIYVDVPPPEDPVLRLPEGSRTIASPTDADGHARELLARIRGVYALPAWEAAPMFEAAVARYLEDTTKSSRTVLDALGFAGADGVIWACDDVTVETCIDRWLWDPRRRPHLLSTAIDSYGLHTTLDSRGVHLTLLLVDAS